MPKWKRCRVAMLAIALIFSATLALAQNQGDWASLISAGQTDRLEGRIDLSIANLRQAESFAGNDQERLRAYTELGTSLRQARRLDEAELALRAALALATGEQGARIEFELANLASLRKDAVTARRHYLLAQEIAGMNSPLGISASLNLLRSLNHSEQLLQLTTLFDQIAAGAR